MNKKGFTLIEILIYLGLFSFVVGGLLVFTYRVIEGSGDLQSKVALSEEAIFILRKLDWALSGATVISVPSATSLQITKPSLPGGERPLLFALSGENFTLQRGTGAALPLNSESIRVTALNFTYEAASGGVPASLRTEFTLSNMSETRSFDSTTHLRQ